MLKCLWLFFYFRVIPRDSLPDALSSKKKKNGKLEKLLIWIFCSWFLAKNQKVFANLQFQKLKTTLFTSFIQIFATNSFWTGVGNFGSGHSTTRANLKSKIFLSSTTSESKYMLERPKICINWNPLFQTSLHKIFKNCSTIFTFRGPFTK